MATFDVETYLRRQAGPQRFLVRLAGRVATGALAGLLAAAITLWLDGSAGLILPFPVSNTQLLLGTLVGAMVTIAVFMLWMRAVVVGLASSQASPRVLSGYLEDTFQRRLAAWTLAGFAYLAAVTVALPSHPAGGQGVPAVSTIVSLLIAMAALSGVLGAMHNATSNVSIPHVVRTLADRVFAVMAAQHAPNDPPPSTAAGGTKAVLHAPRMGWIQWIEHDAIVERLPADTVLTVGVDISDFVAEGQPVAWADAELDGETADAILGRFAIVPTRTSEYDLAYAIQQLVDVADRAMTPSSRDTSTAYEALMHLRAVFHRLIEEGTATGHLRGEDGRWVVAQRSWEPAHHLHVAFQRLVTGGSQDPTTAQELRAVMRALERAAHAVGDTASRDTLATQCSRLDREMSPEVAAATGDRL